MKDYIPFIDYLNRMLANGKCVECKIYKSHQGPCITMIECEKCYKDQKKEQ